MDIVKFSYDIDDIYKKCNTKEFALTIVVLFVFLSTILPHDKMAIVNFILFQYLLFLFVAHKSTSKLRNDTSKENKKATSNQKNEFNQNNFTETANEKSKNTEIQKYESTTTQKVKRAYVSSPAPKGEIFAQEAASMLGISSAVLTLLRKYKREALEYDLDTDESYGPEPIQKRKKGRVTYLESEIIRHITLIQEGKIQYVTEAQHYERINKHNLKKTNC